MNTSEPDDSIPLFTVVRPGLMTTVQDLGRPGYQRYGVAPGGAMDQLSLRIANALAGNRPSDAALEITLLGPELAASTACIAAIAGADLAATLDGAPIAPNASFAIAAGQTLRFGRRLTGARAYLAIAGGFDSPLVMGSRATFARAGFGGLEGRPLRAGDILRGRPRLPADLRRLGWRLPLGSESTGPVTVRLLPGPHGPYFAPDAVAALASAEYTISPHSDRMGLRLDGSPIPRGGTDDMPSEAAPLGAVQVPADGLPIVLIADRQTTGGYPIIGVVIAADIPILAQFAPGDALRFAPTTLADAHAAWRGLQHELSVIELGARLRG